jgi:hypothetical protein
MGERQMLVVRTRKRQRPALADQAHVRQRLFDCDSALPSPYDEHEIEIAVANFADRPGCWRTAQLRRDPGKLRKIVAQIGLPQNSIFVLPGGIPRSLMRGH